MLLYIKKSHHRNLKFQGLHWIYFLCIEYIFSALNIFYVPLHHRYLAGSWNFCCWINYICWNLQVLKQKHLWQLKFHLQVCEDCESKTYINESSFATQSYFVVKIVGRNRPILVLIGLLLQSISWTLHYYSSCGSFISLQCGWSLQTVVVLVPYLPQSYFKDKKEH